MKITLSVDFEIDSDDYPNPLRSIQSLLENTLPFMVDNVEAIKFFDENGNEL
jgi:hypothetical protein